MKILQREKTKILITGTSYSFLLYLLLKEDWKSTNFIFRWTFSQEIFNKLSKKYKCRYSEYGILKSFRRKRKGKILQFISYYYEVIYWQIYVLWIKITKKTEVYGDDYIEISAPFRKIFNYILEDGLGNYAEYIPPVRSFKENIKFLFKGIYPWYIPGGKAKNIEKIYLTGLAEIPESIKSKVEVVDLQKLWNSKSEVEKLEILELFSFENDIFEKIKGRDIILLSQPLSEDNFMDEDEKIGLYANIMKNYDIKNMIIKTHPREKTDYRKYFPEALILDSGFPLEILVLLGAEFKKAVTIFSTSALRFGENCQIDFYGTKINDKLLKVFGDISLETLKRKKVGVY